MELKLVTNYKTLEAHAAQWDVVAGDFPFFRFAWMGSWIKHLGKSCQLAVLVAVDDDGQWLGIVPWCIDHSDNMAKRLRYISSGVACADYMRPISSAEDETGFLSAVADWLVDNVGPDGPFGKIDSIELDGITLNDPETSYFVDTLSACGLGRHTLELEGCWKTELPSDWSEFESQCSKSMRRKTRKATQRLASEQTEIRSTQDTPFEELWPTFVQMHQLRYQVMGQSGCFADPNFHSFLHDAVKDLVESGHGEIVEILNEGTPLASMLLLNDGETVYMYQSGCCDKRAALEPRYQMVASAIKRSIDQGFKAFDFLRGDEPYKARWNTTRVPLSRVKFIPGTVSAQVDRSNWQTGKSLKEHALATG